MKFSLPNTSASQKTLGERSVQVPNTSASQKTLGERSVQVPNPQSPIPNPHFATDLWCAIAPNGCFNQLNAAWEELLGWKQSELIAKSWLASVHQDDIKGVVEASQSLTRGEVIQFENRHSHKNGSFRWVRWRMLLSENGCIYGIGRDMTAQKQRYQQHNAQMQHMDTWRC